MFRLQPAMNPMRILLVAAACVLLLGSVPAFARDAPANQSPRIIQTVEPQFPPALISRSIYSGEARVILMIDADGKLADWLLVSYSHPLIGREATEALRQWRFEPARRNHQPVDARIELTFSFQATGMILSVTGPIPNDRFLQPEDRNTERICPPRELDAPLRPARAVGPLWPAEWKTTASEARVVLDFFVDEEGRPRMPVVRETDHDALIMPAIEALSHWRFEVPTRRGTPVIVRAVQPFRFHRR